MPKFYPKNQLTIATAPITNITAIPPTNPTFAMLGNPSKSIMF